MKAPLLLALLLAGMLAAFLLVAPPVFAARDQAHADLLRRERDLLGLERELGIPDPAAFGLVLSEHARLAAEFARRSAAFTGPSEPAPRLDELLAAAPPALRPGGPLHDELRRLARLPQSGEAAAPPTEQELALTRVVEVLALAEAPLSVDALELPGAGAAQPLDRLPGWRRIELRLVLAGALPDLLRALELLAPEAGGRAPWLGVTEASLRRIEPSHWGESLHQLETPPLRLSVTLDALFAPGAAP